MLLAIDPGKCIGAAVFDEGVLINGIALEIPRASVRLFKDYKIEECIIEIPRVYPIQRWKGDPNDLIKVTWIAGVIAGIGYSIRPHLKVRKCFPSDWKGQRPKKIDNEYTISKLSPKELIVLNQIKTARSKKHNIIDAIGIGLWCLGRR